MMNDKKKIQRICLVVFQFICVVFIISFMIIRRDNGDTFDGWDSLMFGIVCILILLIYIQIKNLLQPPFVKESYASDLRERLSVEEKDILELMIDNMQEIRDYFLISKNHAKRSFILAVCASIFGFIILGSAIVMYLIHENLQPTIITLISGAIVECFAGTALWVHGKSLYQLNHYYDALHTNERFLSTVNLVSKLNKEKQDEMYIEIIRNEMSISCYRNEGQVEKVK